LVIGCWEFGFGLIFSCFGRFFVAELIEQPKRCACEQREQAGFEQKTTEAKRGFATRHLKKFVGANINFLLRKLKMKQKKILP